MRHVVRDFEAQSNAGRAERDPEVGADAEVQGEDRFDLEFVDRQQEVAAVNVYDDDIAAGSGAAASAFDEGQKRRAHSTGQVVSDAAEAGKSIGQNPAAWRILEQPDDA